MKAIYAQILLAMLIITPSLVCAEQVQDTQTQGHESANIEPSSSFDVPLSINAQELQTVDRVLARVNGRIVTHSDLKKPHVTGFYTLAEAVEQELLIQEGIKRKMLPTDQDVEKRIASVRGMYSTPGKPIDDQTFEMMLMQDGYTLKEYKEEVARFMAIGKLLSSEVQSKVFVSKQDIEKHYKANPTYTKEEFSLQTALIPFSQASTVAEVKKVKKVDWVDTGWTFKEDLSDELKFVTKLRKGKCGKPLKRSNGFLVVRMKDKKPKKRVPLAERKSEIEQLLHSQKLEIVEREFREGLRKKATIEYLT